LQIELILWAAEIESSTLQAFFRERGLSRHVRTLDRKKRKKTKQKDFRAHLRVPSQ
jgi:hypothetical protein